MTAVTDPVTDQVGTDADVRVALKAAGTAESLGVLESRDDQGEAVVGGAPAVRVVAERHVVGPGDDEPVAAHGAGLGVAGDVGLQTRLLMALLSLPPRHLFKTWKELKIMH